MDNNARKRYVLEGYTSLEGQNLKNFKFEKVKNTHYIWHEFRGWTYFWGRDMSSEDMTNNMLDEFNRSGWKIKQFMRHDGYFPNLGFFNALLISVMSLLTFGFIAYFSGHYVLLEKDFNSYEEGKIEKDIFLKAVKIERRNTFRKSLIIFSCFFAALIVLFKLLLIIPWYKLYFNLFV